ncbi:MAG: DUF4827 domain-containing protein [Prevotellaceae bacterium]|nr:DUF4827 domain-containing protein [Prevotellaceae bacterium]
MKKLLNLVLAVFAVSISIFTAVSCNDGETYAEMKEKEKKAIEQFIANNSIIGSIKVISESQFSSQGYTTNLDNNEFVLFNNDGIYMQIIRQGEGQTMQEMAMERKDSTVTKPLLCRFFEYDIENADTTYSNIYTPSVVDKIQCTYSHYSRSFTASFTEGRMYSAYGSVVPQGWLKPLNYIRLSREAGKEAKVRIIVPHSSGTTNASGYVLPFYYEISYQLPPNS